MVEAQSCGTILWLCDSVEKTTARVNWKTENLSLHYAKAPQPIDTKIGVKYYVSDIYQHTKLHHNLLNSFFSTRARGKCIKNVYWVSGILHLATPKALAGIFSAEINCQKRRFRARVCLFLAKLLSLSTKTCPFQTYTVTMKV